jgi:hypothetical protein
MAKSPCIGCEFELADKNNTTCRECDRRVEYVALIEGDAMEKTEIRDQRSEIRSRKPKRSDKICLIEGCDNKMLNRGLCSMHYQQWRLGKIVHPVLGKFTVSQARIRSKAKTNLVKKAPVKKKEVKKQKSEVGSRKSENARKAILKTIADAAAEKVTEGVKANLPGALKVDLDNYPKIKHQIDFLADKYLVNSEHVIIGLLGEALAARRERSDHE